MVEDDKLRFKIKDGDVEVELEGKHAYVMEKFEDLFEELSSRLRSGRGGVGGEKIEVISSLEGIVEKTSDGRPYLTVPVDAITSKEAVALFLYAMQPERQSDKALSELLTTGWKTMRSEAVRARASELRREGRLVSEKGVYGLSGAGVQWVEREILKKIRGF